MKRQHIDRGSLIVPAILVSLTTLPVFPVHAQPAPLPSWDEGAAKQAIDDWKTVFAE
jgi:hypothetical protein